MIWGGKYDFFFFFFIAMHSILWHIFKKKNSIILHLFEMFTYSFVAVLFLRNVFVRQITVLHKGSVFELIVIAQTAIGAMQL